MKKCSPVPRAAAALQVYDQRVMFLCHQCEATLINLASGIHPNNFRNHRGALVDGLKWAEHVSGKLLALGTAPGYPQPGDTCFCGRKRDADRNNAPRVPA